VEAADVELRHPASVAALRENVPVIRQGTRDDFDAVYALIASPQSSPEFLRARWAVPSFVPERHLWIAGENGEAAAFGALYAPDEAVARGDAAHIAPLLERIEAQARAEGFPKLMFVVPDRDEPAWRAYVDAGFEITTKVLQMEVALDTPRAAVAFPDGVTVRTYRDDDARAVQTLLDEAYASWNPTETPMAHEDWLAWMTGTSSFDRSFWWLAEAGGELAGVCLTWIEGWVKDLAVAAPWRGRGLGKALLLHALAEHRAHGTEVVGLKVDAVNPTGAPQLYERVGFRTVSTLLTLEKPL
jgi:ribosomal protein S18 acetylase RimI-like enzyme